MKDVLYVLASESAEHLPMEEAVNPLLPKNYDLVWSLVCFIIILLVFWKFVLPKFQEVLSEREDRIQGGIQRAEAAQAEAKAALEKYNSQLSDARAEAAEIREQARERGKQIEAEIKEQATQESQRIVESGEKQLQASRQQVVSELRQEMGQTSISLAEKLLGGELSESSRQAGTIDSFLADLDSLATPVSAGK
ncbi:F0F1 ATP synthase subunit B [Corynebacterium uberis]|uniref:F0F1 ATP synthase subunit B n=1 Tax=Corynebacterium TaxID=1716 RepID=UPI001D09BAAC|nr:MULTISPECIES: F0F1 ATP synthase subunit B [Corynebacterium]MCZ9309051.1 F0F1 ATP synthase subunit B [Corynebacterium sp. c6VSa_13]UDL74484.1 F0F1 ATP synthase subunit B [Corynebacterium uberis]UDL76681.1 F0F1 ATP synthase subunit B [Corynebacterium uberis]UDL78894.1 F0F1 ATP synthase subunit B [Corynebacterium uberis]UDL81172.1 F0F1 ATP synthase subunit B [Corynebacterium uberis]